MKFQDLSQDLLRQISDYLHWLDVENLWFCNCRVLNSRLAKGGVAQLEIECSTSLTRFSWPKFIASLSGLSRFSFNDYGISEQPPITSDILSSLPSTLRFLTLEVNGAFLAFNELLTRHPDSLGTLENLEIHCNDLQELAALKERRWPKFLRSLIFRGACDSHYHLDPSTLPPTLTLLDVVFYAVHEHPLGPFPTALEALHLKLQKFYDILPLLPSSVTSLKLIALNNRYTTCPEMARWPTEGFPTPLPPSLTSLTLPVERYTSIMLRQLPHSITEMDQSKKPVDPEDVPLLPPQLRSAGWVLPPHITADIAKLLPKSVTSANSTVSLDALPFLEHWRQYLWQTMSQSTLLQLLEKNRMQRIPGDLAQLFEMRVPVFPIQALPTKLTHLLVTRLSMASFSLNALPRTLQVLHVETGHISESVEEWKMLPNLRLLQMGQCPELTPESSTFLPASLKSFKVKQVDGDVTPLKWFDGLPKNLTYLSVPIEFPSPFSGNINLPKHLKEWVVTVSNPKGDVLRKVLQKSVPANILFFTLGLASTDPSQTYAKQKEPFQLLIEEDAIQFLQTHQRICRLGIRHVCYDSSHFSIEEVSSYLPPSCYEAAFR